MKDPKKVKMGRASKNKGKVGEREVANLLKSYGFEAKRGVQFGRGESDNPDVKHNIPNTHIEVKRTEGLSLYKAMDQAEDDAGSTQKPIVFHRRNNREWLVIMKAEDYLKLEGGTKEAPPVIDYSTLEF